MLGYALLVCCARRVPALCRCWRRPPSARPGAAAFRFDNLTLDNFHYLLFEQTPRAQTIIHSFIYSAVTACVASRWRSRIAYVVSRRLRAAAAAC